MFIALFAAITGAVYVLTNATERHAARQNRFTSVQAAGDAALDVVYGRFSHWVNAHTGLTPSSTDAATPGAPTNASFPAITGAIDFSGTAGLSDYQVTSVAFTPLMPDDTAGTDFPGWSTWTASPSSLPGQGQQVLHRDAQHLRADHVHQRAHLPGQRHRHAQDHRRAAPRRDHGEPVLPKERGLAVQLQHLHGRRVRGFRLGPVVRLGGEHLRVDLHQARSPGHDHQRFHALRGQLRRSHGHVRRGQQARVPGPHHRRDRRSLHQRPAQAGVQDRGHPRHRGRDRGCQHQHPRRQHGVHQRGG